MKPTILGIVSGKGGVGKTTVAINLATTLAVNYGREVLLIDANITTSHIGVFLGIYKPRIVINEFLRGRRYKLVKDVEFPTYIKNLKLLLASLSLKDIENVNIMNLPKLVDEIEKTKRFEVILIDSAPCLGKEALGTMFASNSLVIVSNPTIQSLIDVLRLVEKSSEIGVDIKAIILNRIRGKSYEVNEDDIRTFTNVNDVLKVPFDKKVLKAIGKKRPVVLEYPNSKASIAFSRIAAFLLGEKPLIPKKKRGIRSIIKSLLKF